MANRKTPRTRLSARRAPTFPGERANIYTILGKLSDAISLVATATNALHAPSNVLAEAAPEGFRRVRVHDLKHTFGRRLRAAGVSFEDRRELLGHKSGRITTHYSQSELANLIAAADKICATDSRKTPATTWLRRKSTVVFARKGLLKK